MVVGVKGEFGFYFMFAVRDLAEWTWLECNSERPCQELRNRKLEGKVSLSVFLSAQRSHNKRDRRGRRVTFKGRNIDANRHMEKKNQSGSLATRKCKWKPRWGTSVCSTSPTSVSRSHMPRQWNAISRESWLQQPLGICFQCHSVSGSQRV